MMSIDQAEFDREIAAGEVLYSLYCTRRYP
jgi:hypothetical protein